MTIQKAAEYLGVTRQTVYRKIRAGVLPVTSITPRSAVAPSKLLVYRADVERIAREGWPPAPPPAAQG